MERDYIDSDFVYGIGSSGSQVDQFYQSWENHVSQLGLHFNGKADDYNALKEISTQINGDAFVVSYRSTIGDGGGGIFVWNSSDLSNEVTSDIQSGVYVAPNTDLTGASGCWVRHYDGPLNVKWFGAKGDGVTDDTDALNNATSVGGNKYVPAGTYLTTTGVMLADNTTLFGDGIDVTIIKIADDATCDTYGITNEQNTRFSGQAALEENITNLGNTNIHIRDLTVDGNNTRGVTDVGYHGSSVALASCSNSSIKRVKAINGWLHCIDVCNGHYTMEVGWGIRSNGVTILDCIAVDPRLDDGITTHFCDDIYIENCRSYMTNEDELTSEIPHYTNQHGLEIDDGSNNVTVVGCSSDGFFEGLQIKGHTTNLPATNVTVYGFTAKNAHRCFNITHGGLLETDEHFGKAKNVKLIGCSAINPKRMLSHTDIVASLRIRDYRGVDVVGFTVNGIETAIDDDSGKIYIADNASDINIIDAHINNVNNNLYGAIHVSSDAGDNINMSNISAVNCFGVIVRVTSTHILTVNNVKSVFTGLVTAPDTDHDIPLNGVVVLSLGAMNSDTVKVSNILGDDTYYTNAIASYIDYTGTESDKYYLPNDGDSNKRVTKAWTTANSDGGVAGNPQFPISVGWFSGYQNLGEGESVGYAFRLKVKDDDEYISAYIASSKDDALDTDYTSRLDFATLNHAAGELSPTVKVIIEPEGHITPAVDNAASIGSASNTWGSVYANTYFSGAGEGASGSFTTADGKTVTVSGGIITSIV